MKIKVLFFASILALTGCGSNGPAISDITPGDEVSQSEFEAAFAINNIFKHSNYHAEVTYNQYGAPAESEASYSKSLDLADGKMKIQFNRFNEPYYYDFTNSGETSPYTLDIYTPEINSTAETIPYTKTTQNVTISNDFMRIMGMTGITGGRSLVLASGLSYSQFTFASGIYQLVEPVVVTEPGATATFDVFKLSFIGDCPKDIYYHMIAEVEMGGGDKMTVSAEARIIFTNQGHVKVNLPIVE